MTDDASHMRRSIRVIGMGVTQQVRSVEWTYAVAWSLEITLKVALDNPWY